MSRPLHPALFIALAACLSLPVHGFAGSKTLIKLGDVSLSLTGRNVLELKYAVQWTGKTGPEAGLINGKHLKIMGIVQKLEDKDLVFHNTIFVDTFPMETPLDATYDQRTKEEQTRLTNEMNRWMRSISSLDILIGNDRKKAEGGALVTETERLLSPSKSCTKTPQMTIESGAVRLKKADVDTSNLGVTIPEEGNYWNVEQPLALETLCWLKTEVFENGSDAKVEDLVGEIDLRYVVIIHLEDASGYQYEVEFKTQKLTRFGEVKDEVDDGAAGSTRKQEVVGFDSLEIK